MLTREGWQDIRKVADELADELIEVTAASEQKESRCEPIKVY